MIVDGIEVQLLRKNIKNLHLSVHPPEGKVRVAAPESFTEDNIRLAVISRLAWIKKQQKAFLEQPRQSLRQYVSGECHYFLGKQLRLELREQSGKHNVVRQRSGKLTLIVSANTTVERKEKLVNEWYRAELRKLIIELLDKWQPIIGKHVNNWGIKKMKTKWGSCNIEAKRIWLNLELAKKSPQCLEYILVHELVHLHERHHNIRFQQLMDKFLPNWKQSRDILKSEPLAFENWGY